MSETDKIIVGVNLLCEGGRRDLASTIMAKKVTAKMLTDRIDAHVRAETGFTSEKATARDFWTALSKIVVELISDNWEETRVAYSKERQAYYLSAEFLEGRSLLNNLVNLGIYNEAKEALASFGYNLTDILEEETDPALGNGGQIGRAHV